MGIKLSKNATSKISLPYHHSLNSINNDLSCIDVVLLSRLIYNVGTITYNKTKLDLVVIVRWKNHNLICMMKHNISLSKSNIASSDKKLKKITNDDNTSLYVHLLRQFSRIYVRDNTSIIILRYNSISRVKRRDTRDIIWYSGSTTTLSDTQILNIDYIVIDNNVIEFMHSSPRVMTIISEDRYYHYRLDIKMFISINITNNVRIALRYIVDEYYN